MKAVKPVKGLDWDVGAIGTATWSGVLLRDVLAAAGVDAERAQESDSPLTSWHVHFVGADRDPVTGEVYAASIPLEWAVSPARVRCCCHRSGLPPGGFDSYWTWLHGGVGGEGRGVGGGRGRRAARGWDGAAGATRHVAECGAAHCGRSCVLACCLPMPRLCEWCRTCCWRTR